jgi:antitoxin component of RelBE/YafQ-DinJ toxin-antitoxin module
MNTTLHVTVDRKTKDQAAKLAREMGLDLSSVVKASLQTFVQTQTFHVEHSPRMTPYLEKLIALARADFKAGRNISPGFDDAKKAMVWLKKNA